VELAIKQNNNLSPYAKALSSQLITEMEKSDVLCRFSDLISQVYFINGQKLENGEAHAHMLMLLCNGLYDEITKYFRFLRIDEVDIALNNGVRGEYGEYFGVNVKSFHQWLRAYQISEVRKSKLKEVTRQEKEVDKEQAKKKYWQTILKGFMAYKEKGELDLFMPTELFRQLWNNGFIKLTKEQSDRYLELAKQKLASEKEMLKRPTSKYEKQRAEVLGALLSAFDSGKQTKEQDKILKSKAAELAIKDYYLGEAIERFTGLCETAAGTKLLN